MIRKCYFDTCVYNQIVDSKLTSDVQKITKDNSLTIFLSDQNLQEFSLCEHDRFMELIIAASKVCNHYILIDIKGILRDDCYAYINQKNAPVHYVEIQFSDEKIIQYLGKRELEEKSENDRVLKKRSKALLIEHKEKFRDGIENGNISFNEFLTAGVGENFGKVVYDILSYSGVDVALLKGINSKLFIEVNKSLKYHIDFVIALYYYSIVDKPKWGDMADSFHVFYINDVDVFVTSDERFKFLLQKICPQKDVLLLNEFILKYTK